MAKEEIRATRPSAQGTRARWRLPRAPSVGSGRRSPPRASCALLEALQAVQWRDQRPTLAHAPRRFINGALRVNSYSGTPRLI